MFTTALLLFLKIQTGAQKSRDDNCTLFNYVSNSKGSHLLNYEHFDFYPGFPLRSRVYLQNTIHTPPQHMPYPGRRESRGRSLRTPVSPCEHLQRPSIARSLASSRSLQTPKLGGGGASASICAVPGAVPSFSSSCLLDRELIHILHTSQTPIPSN